MAADHSSRLLWCDIRTSAVGFYSASGFEMVGNEFVIAEVGPHYVMVRSIED